MHGIVHTLEPAYAMVSHTGRVFLSRPGSLEVMCKFSGLVAFPFDQLKCSMEFGGWGFSGGQQGIELYNGGYQFSSQEGACPRVQPVESWISLATHQRPPC